MSYQGDGPPTKAKAGYAALIEIQTLRLREAIVLLTLCGYTIRPRGTRQSKSYR